MKKILLPCIAFLLACSSGSEYQPILDSKFGGEKISFELTDTTTMQENRLYLLKILGVRHPDKESALRSLTEQYEAYLALCANGLDEETCNKGFARIKADREKAYAELRSIDSLERLIDGFDKNDIFDVRGFYKFKIGTDTFNYLVVFDGNKNIISADKR